MATTITTTTSISTKTSSAQLKVQVQPIKPKCCKSKETTISCSSASTAAANNNNGSKSVRKLDPPTVVSADSSWCCAASYPLPTPPPPPPPSPPPIPPQVRRVPDQGLNDSLSGFKIRYSPGSVSPVMDFSSNDHSPSSFTKFNSALTAGLLNPMSPPPLPDKTRASPTLFEMMASEPDVHPRTQIQNQAQIQIPISGPRQNQPPPVIDKQALTMQRISGLLSTRSLGNLFNDRI